LNQQRRERRAVALLNYVKLLNIHSGDIIVYRGRDDVAKLFTNLLSTTGIPPNVLFVHLRGDDNLQILNDEQMERAGWRRIAQNEHGP
jgi:hypothetical protein